MQAKLQIHQNPRRESGFAKSDMQYKEDSFLKGKTLEWPGFFSLQELFIAMSTEIK